MAQANQHSLSHYLRSHYGDRTFEHLYRWTNWDILKNSDAFKKLDSKTVEFLLQLPVNGEKTLAYKVHYSW